MQHCLTKDLSLKYKVLYKTYNFKPKFEYQLELVTADFTDLMTI